MKALKIRHAWHEDGDFEIFRPNGTLSDYIFLHFWNPMQILYEGKNITTFPNACIIFSPGAPQHFSSKEDSIHDWMHITDDVSDLLREFGIETERIYYPKNHKVITDMIRQIEVESKAKNPYSDELVSCLIREFFVRFAREVSKENDSGKLNGQTKEQLKQLRIILQSDYARHWEISDMARYINLSPSYLYSAYKKLFGVSPMQDLINTRMQQAKSLLAESKKSVRDISESLGYASQSHFIRQFTKNVGISPLQYRQNNSLENRHIF